MRELGRSSLRAHRRPPPPTDPPPIPPRPSARKARGSDAVRPQALRDTTRQEFRTQVAESSNATKNDRKIVPVGDAATAGHSIRLACPAQQCIRSAAKHRVSPHAAAY